MNDGKNHVGRRDGGVQSHEMTRTSRDGVRLALALMCSSAQPLKRRRVPLHLDLLGPRDTGCHEIGTLQKFPYRNIKKNIASAPV